MKRSDERAIFERFDQARIDKKFLGLVPGLLGHPTPLHRPRAYHGRWRVKIGDLNSREFSLSGAGLVRSYKIRLNHRSDSNAETSPVSAAAAANRALISMSFFSSKNRELSDSYTFFRSVAVPA
jgi:hypothetical protein